MQVLEKGHPILLITILLSCRWEVCLHSWEAPDDQQCGSSTVCPFWAVWYRFVLSIMQTYLSRLLERVQYLIVYKHVIGISGFFFFFFFFFLTSFYWLINDYVADPRNRDIRFS